jgi:glycosyltransferase involved in cell wall biosynthesis
MAHIGIVTGAHLCRNPRVVKEAGALREAGHRVTVLGPALEAGLAEEDVGLAAAGGFEHVYVVDVREHSASRLRHRLVRRAAVEAVGRLGLQRPEALGYGVRDTLAAARELCADLTIGHQEVGVFVAAQLLREGQRAGADIEDWHSEDQLLTRAQRPQRVLRASEAVVLRRGTHVTTTSEALAHALAARYDASEPSVLYNAFPWADREELDGAEEDRSDRSRPSLHWVSQTIGPGRGLETLCEALALVEHPVDVHLRGRSDVATEAWLRAQFPSDRGHRLSLHGLVPAAELLSRIAEHDVGLALEQKEPPSRDLTVTNKVLHYLVGGLAVVATDTGGQREVAAAAPEAVRLCAMDAVSMGEAISAIVAEPAALDAAKAAAVRAARDLFCWERQVPVLLASVERALGGSLERGVGGSAR